MDYWNAIEEGLQPETLAVLRDEIEGMPHHLGYPDLAGCGCEIEGRDGHVHLCEFHMGYDCGVEAIRRRQADGEEEEEERQGL